MSKSTYPKLSAPEFVGEPAVKISEVESTLPAGVIEHATSEVPYVVSEPVELRVPLAPPAELRGTYLTCVRCGDYVKSDVCEYCLNSGVSVALAV